MTEKPLYEDEKFKIDYLNNFFKESTSTDDHYLQIKGNPGTGSVIPRHVLRQLAKTPSGGIERIFDTLDSSFVFQIKEIGIKIDRIHIALCQAYIEEERRIREFTP